MKKILVILLLLAPAAFIVAQHNENDNGDFHFRQKRPKDCDSRVQKLDSLTTFNYSADTDEFVPVSRVYFYYDSNLDHIASLTVRLPEKTNISYQTYKWDANGNWTEYLYQEWKNETWVDVRLWQYYFDSNNKIQSETHAAKDALGNWQVYERQFYNYENGILVNYLRQNTDNNGEWYDVARHYYTYNSLGQLINLYGEYTATNVIFWDRTSYYNEAGQLYERFLKRLKYNPVLKKNELVNNVHNTYSYDIYGSVKELFNDSWINESWQLTSKSVYHYSLIPGKKVNICHNGHQICVAAEAVKAHLEHGDKLGACSVVENNREENSKGKESSDKSGNKSLQFTAYPNPTSSIITISFKENENPFKNGWLISSGGTKIFSFEVKGKSEVIVDLSSLMNGAYYIRLESKERTESLTVIKK